MSKTPTLPSNINTEKNLISCLIQKPSLIRSLDLTPDLFSREQIRRIFLVLVEMEEEGRPIDPVTLSEEIRVRKWESFCGGSEEILELSEIAFTTSHAPHYAEILSRISLSRKILLRLKEVQDASDDPEDAALKLSSILEMAQKTTQKVSEIVSVASIWPEVEGLHRDGKKRGLSTGWGVLDDFYTLRRGDLTVATGIPGAGKSSFVDNLAINAARDHDWKTLYFSAENFPVTNHVANLLEILLELPFNPGSHRRMTREEIGQAKDFLDAHFSFLDPAAPTVDRILSLAQNLLKTKPFDQLVIDPWNQLDHDFGGGSETQYIARALAKIRRFARTFQVHVVIVAHPMKLQKEKGQTHYPVPTLYDIAGSAHFRNMADNGIVLYRQPQSDEVDIHIQKIRFREVGKLGSCRLRYDRLTGRFLECEPIRYEDERYH